jgi:hypothetical protein
MNPEKPIAAEGFPRKERYPDQSVRQPEALYFISSYPDTLIFNLAELLLLGILPP